ncbi:MAG TPA: phosphoribosyl-AMP cyclohydrolase [Anaeromyxobacter sp.]
MKTHATAGRAPAPLDATALVDRVKFDDRGLVPVVAQELDGTVLMLAWANREALLATVREGRGVYWSRSRGELWRKGDTSGHVQEVREIALDCDSDAVLYVVRQEGPACHTGTRSCFSERQEIPWQTSASSHSSGPRSSRARPTKAPGRATPASSSRPRPASGGRSSRKRTR